MIDLNPNLRLDRTGVIHVGHAGVSLDALVEAHQKGAPSDAILARYPGLTETELQAALDYHLAQGGEGLPRGPEQRDAHWRKWNATLEDDMGTDTAAERADRRKPRPDL